MDVDYRDSKMTDNYVNRQRREEGERRITNVFSLVIFILFVLSYIGVIAGVSAFDIKEYAGVVDSVMEFLSLNKGKVIFISCITTLVMFSYAYLLKGLLTKFLIILGIIYNVTMISSMPILVILNLIFMDRLKATLEILILDLMLIFLIVYKVAALISAIKVKLNFIIEVTKESCRAIFHFPLLTVFTYIFFVPTLVLSIWVGYGLLVYLFFGNESAPKLSEVCFNIYINIGFIVIINFLMYFVRSVISDCIATWYWSDNKDDVHQMTIFKSIRKVFRYHLGTIAYASSYIFPIIQAILVLIKIKSNDGLANKGLVNKFISFITRIYLTFQISEFALIHSSVDGHDFYQSSKKACVLALRHPSRFIAGLDSFGGALDVGSSIVVLVITFSMGFMVDNNNSTTNLTQYTPLIALLSLIFLMPVYLILCTSARTIIMCTLEDLSENDGTLEKPYYMNQQLKGLLIN